MDTRFYTSNSDNKHLIIGTNQMNPCEVCEDYMEEYICYANSKSTK